MDNEYRAAIKEFRLSWLEREYGELFSAGHVSAPIAKWIHGEGGVRGMKEDSLDSFGDLLCRSKDAVKKRAELAKEQSK